MHFYYDYPSLKLGMRFVLKNRGRRESNPDKPFNPIEHLVFQAPYAGLNPYRLALSLRLRPNNALNSEPAFFPLGLPTRSQVSTPSLFPGRELVKTGAFCRDR